MVRYRYRVARLFTPSFYQTSHEHSCTKSPRRKPVKVQISQRSMVYGVIGPATARSRHVCWTQKFWVLPSILPRNVQLFSSENRKKWNAAEIPYHYIRADCTREFVFRVSLVSVVRSRYASLIYGAFANARATKRLGNVNSRLNKLWT